MINPNKTLTSTTGRTFIYLSIFIAGSALTELLVQLIKPLAWSNTSLVITLLILGAFGLVGVLFACQQHSRSRLTSSATLLILGLIALSVGHHAIPDSYLLLIALGVAAVGAQPVLHRKFTSSKQAALYNFLTVVVTVAIAFTYVYGLTVLDRIAYQ
jgi:predicted membrane channel-forming protein YqfA (hemolysin III family)